MEDNLRIMLRDINGGELTDHNFLDRQHALDWLKADKNNETRYTVCYASVVKEGPLCMGGYFQRQVENIHREMTVEQFIEDALTEKDKNAP